MRRADAFALVGEFGWPLLDDGRPSNSLARAKSYRVPIASERQFLEWLGKSAPEEQAKTYSADQLASLSKLPKEIVDQLSMFGLIEARNGLYGFRDLAAARQVAGLLAAGTALSVITKSLHEIRKWLPDAGLSNLKLFPESSDCILVEQMEGRTDKTGQFVLDVEKPADNAAVFEEGGLSEFSSPRWNGSAFVRAIPYALTTTRPPPMKTERCMGQRATAASWSRRLAAKQGISFWIGR
jgi:hypothetical protein